MKSLLTLAAIFFAITVFPACEKQDYQETKMFHDVPKRTADQEPTAKPEAPKPAEEPKKE